MDEFLQLYEQDGTVIAGKGASRAKVFSAGLLHGASHVWIWRSYGGAPEILVQKRAAQKPTWPNKFDISTAGHIDLDEEPMTAALREAKEEIGLEINPDNLQEVSREKISMTAKNGVIENEFIWLYIYKVPADTKFVLKEDEVASLVWKHLDDFEAECLTDRYVPHGEEYYSEVIGAIRSAMGAAGE